MGNEGQARAAALRKCAGHRPLALVTGLLAGALLASFAAPLKAQQTGTVRGVVFEAGSSRPLASAEVQVSRIDGAPPGVTIAAITDGNGAFVLDDVPPGSVEVRASYLGHSTRTLTVQVAPGSAADAVFELPPTVFDLDEIVVTGTGGAFQKKQLGNTIAVVDASQLADAPLTSLSEMLQAREPAVVGLTSDGATGSGTRLRIRGSNSLSMSNEPVVYVDGIRVDNSGGMGGNGRHGVNGSRLDDINWESIERVEVLKGAAAATLYGSEASSGVIQVFTKTGSPNRTRTTFRLEAGTSQYPDGVIKPQAGFARNDEHAAYLSELYREDLQPFQVFERDFVSDLFETGRFGSISGDVTGGSDEFQYYVSGRYANEDGPLGGQDLGGNTVDEMRRIQANSSFTFFPGQDVTFRLNTRFTDARHDTFDRNNNIGSATTNAMAAKPERAHCFPSSIDTSMFGASTPVCTGDGNPWGTFFTSPAESMQREYTQSAQHFAGSASATWAVSPKVSIDGLVGLDQVEEQQVWRRPFGSNVNSIETRGPFQGERELLDRSHREITLDVKARWSTGVGPDLFSELVVGSQGFISDTRIDGGVGESFPAAGLETIQSAEFNFGFDNVLSKVNLGIFAQEQLGFRDWLYLTLGGRFDKNSAFGRDAGAAFYPKASVSAVLSDLPSWTVAWLPTFRLRAAYGESGLQPGVFDKLTTYRPVSSPEGGGITPFNIGNARLAPERSRELELGGDLGFLDDKLALSVTYWDRTTTNALIQRRFPSAGGFTQPQMDNIGQVDGSGWELSLDAVPLTTRNVSLSLFANAAYLTQIITDMGGEPPITVSGTYARHRNQLAEGHAPGTFFGAQPLPVCGAGIDRACYTPGSTVPFDSNSDGAPDTEAELEAFLTSMDGVPLDHPGMRVLIDDEDGDGDRLDHVLGKPTPDWQGSVGGNLTLWGRLSVNTLFEYRAGDYVVANLTDAFRRTDNRLGRNVRETAEVESTLLNPATRVEGARRVDAALTWANELLSLAPYSGLNLVETGDFVRWRELSVSYLLPGPWSGKIGLDDVSLIFTARNLAVWTGYSGSDPEANEAERCGGGGEAVGNAGPGSGTIQCNFLDATDTFTLPLQRRISFAVRVGF
jgi:TonB-linked SusC/RagA family outer membrane protein